MAQQAQPIALDVAYKDLGNKFFRDGKNDLALEMYYTAICINPECSIYYSNRVVAFTKKGEYDLALEDLRLALEKDPKNIKAWVKGGVCYKFIGDLEKAQEYLEKALSLKPGDEESQRELQDLQEYKVLHNAYIQVVNNENEETLSALEELLKKCTRSVKYKTKKMELLKKFGRMEELKNFCNQCIKDHGVNPDFGLYKIELLVDENKISVAYDLINELIDMYSEEDVKQLEPIINEFKKYDDIESKGNSLLSEGKKQEAIDMFTSALKGQYQWRHFDASLLIKRVNIYATTYEFLKAAQDIQQVIEINKEELEHYVTLGEIYLNLEEFDKALNEFTYVKSKDEYYNSINKLIEDASERKKKPRDFKALLEVSNRLESETLARQFAEKLKRWLPDKNRENEDKYKEACLMFRNIAAAYFVLNDQERNKIYEEKGDVPELLEGFDPQEVYDKFVSSQTEEIKNIIFSIEGAQ
ncbi:hypothetical protein SteCoe_35607 [Stentor coeruleus]|uniref:J domain-containing protein n=1 Tax=Stentor coeruleus TaxID=5963 RepID=A0A1R2AS94_9CILI|nr:hypothetical protein SteCoe_35607 [Stentor coeruleus]